MNNDKPIVVVTRSEPGGAAWMDYLWSHGAVPYHFPTVRTMPVELTPELADVLGQIPKFDWIIFTSPAAPRFFKALSKRVSVKLPAESLANSPYPLSEAPRGVEGSSLEDALRLRPIKMGLRSGDSDFSNHSPSFLDKMPPIAVIGNGTAEAVREAGYEVALQPSVATSESLAKELSPVRGRSILLLRSTIASPELPLALTRSGANVRDVPIYSTELIRESDPEFSELLRDGKIGCLTFASPSAVRGFCARVTEENLLQIAKSVPAVAVGATVAAALEQAGFKKILTAQEPTIESMMAAMRDGR